MEPWTDSRTPALAIVARGDQIKTVSPAEYAVSSQSRPGAVYRVTVLREKWTCDCGFYSETKQTCVHILAVRYTIGFRETAAPEVPTKPPCERCHSGDVVLKGKRRNKSGAVARYECRTCGYHFTGRDGFQNRRSDPQKIALALDLYYRGMSVRKVAEHFAQVHSLKVSPATVYNWIAHFSRVAAEWMDRQGASVGEKWHVDETVVSVDGERHYIWNVLDHETRFLLATRVSQDRSLRDTRAALHEAKHATDDRPSEILTDGLKTYPRAVRLEYGRGGYTPHRRVPSIRAADSNNMVERLHGTEKERIKVMRGFDRRVGAEALMEGFRVHYNLVRDHMALGTTPGAMAGLPSIPGFRWSQILRLATQTEPEGVAVDLVSERSAKEGGGGGNGWETTKHRFLSRAPTTRSRGLHPVFEFVDFTNSLIDAPPFSPYLSQPHPSDCHKR